MKKILSILIAFTLLTGCWKQAEQIEEETPTTTVEKPEKTKDLSVNDFETPTDFDWGWENKGPYEMQLLSARSTDGVKWTRTNQNISKQANTPNMVVTEDGIVYLYYTGGNIAGKEQAIAAAVSQDNGTSWVYKNVTISGGTILSTPGDPDVVIKEDGTFRLYFTAQVKGRSKPGIYYADSTDGLEFTYGGEALNKEDSMIMDSSTFFWKDMWYMFTLDGFDAAHVFASSKNGDNFTFLKKEKIGENEAINYFLSNEIIGTDGVLRAYGFDLRKNGEIRSATSENGVSWKDEGIVHLSLDEGTQNDTINWNDESYYLKDPAVAQLQDGSFLMVYVTRAQQ